ncbi:MAG: hypothetical protein IJI84_00515 [Clostridia bacterium]|nr:hypothetical protein [Clostridia bacterium]
MGRKSLKESDVKPLLKLAMPSTKKLILAGVNGSDEFPKLFADYKWSGTRSYNMALIILAFVNYCRINKIKILNEYDLIKGVADRVGFVIERYLKKNELALEKVLEPVLPKTDKHENKAKRDKVIKSFIKQAGKVKDWITAESTNKKDLRDLFIILNYGDLKGADEKSLKDVVKSGDVKELKEYLEQTSVEMSDIHSAIEYAIGNKCSIKIITLLANYYRSPRFFNGVGMSFGYLAEHAVEHNRNDVAKLFLNYNGGDALLEDYYFAISAAIKNNDLGIIKYILDKTPEREGIFCDRNNLKKLISWLGKKGALDLLELIAKKVDPKLKLAKDAIWNYLKSSDKLDLRDKILEYANLGEFFDGKSDKK